MRILIFVLYFHSFTPPIYRNIYINICPLEKNSHHTELKIPREIQHSSTTTITTTPLIDEDAL